MIVLDEWVFNNNTFRIVKKENNSLTVQLLNDLDQTWTTYYEKDYSPFLILSKFPNPSLHGNREVEDRFEMSKTIDKWTDSNQDVYELLEEEGIPSSRELFLNGHMIMSDEEEIYALYDRLAQLAKEREGKGLNYHSDTCPLSGW